MHPAIFYCFILEKIEDRRAYKNKKKYFIIRFIWQKVREVREVGIRSKRYSSVPEFRSSLSCACDSNRNVLSPHTDSKTCSDFRFVRGAARFWELPRFQQENPRGLTRYRDKSYLPSGYDSDHFSGISLRTIAGMFSPLFSAVYQFSSVLVRETRQTYATRYIAQTRILHRGIDSVMLK